MLSLAKRNINIYFRDRSAVLYSLLGVFILLGLYALFLSKNLVNGFSALPQPEMLVYSWLVAGLCAITPITTSIGSLGAIVEDRHSQLNRDFTVSPLPSSKLIGGYLAGGIVSTTLMSFAALVLGSIWLVASGVRLPGLGNWATIAGVQLLLILSGCSFSAFIVSLFSTRGGLSAASTLVGTLVGFLVGMYMPIGNLATPMQTVIKLFPASHGAVLMRSLLMEPQTDVLFKGMPASLPAEIYEFFGVRYIIDGQTLPLWASAVYLLATSALFFGLAVVISKRKSR